MTANGYWGSFLDDKNVLKLIVVMVSQLCDYTKKNFKRWIFCFVNYISLKLLFKKKKKKKKKEIAGQLPGKTQSECQHPYDPNKGEQMKQKIITQSITTKL